MAVTALLAAPVAGRAQTPQSPQASPPAAEQSNEAPRQAEQRGQALDHVRKAEAALNDIPAESLTSAADRIDGLKRHLDSLERSLAAHSAQQGAPADWRAELSAINGMLKELLDGRSAAGAESAVGTTGATAPGAEAGATVTLDDTARAKLQEVRTHITAFAGAMGSAAAEATGPTSASAPPSAESATATTSPTDPTPTPTGTSATATPQPAGPDQTPDTPQAGAQEPDRNEVRRHLTAARDSLSQLTQLPAAAQLNGETRHHVSQLITNFNELITTSTEWRASYAKVEANLDALLGPEASMAATPEAPEGQNAPGTAGAIGTSGAVSLAPDVRAKLVEFRDHLNEFEKAADGGAPESASATPQPDAGAMTPDGGSDVATRASETDPATASGSTSTGMTGTTGSAAESMATAGTSGTAPAEPQQESRTAQDASSEQTPAGARAAGGDALQHIEAIQAILEARTGEPGAEAGTQGAVGTAGTETSGTAGDASATTPSRLDAAQIQQIRVHLKELRRLVSEGGAR